MQSVTCCFAPNLPSPQIKVLLVMKWMICQVWIVVNIFGHQVRQMLFSVLWRTHIVELHRSWHSLMFVSQLSILCIGVGFAHAPVNSQLYDVRRKELLRLLETCFSHIMYLRAQSGSSSAAKSPTHGTNTDHEQVRIFHF